ncbi:MAG TPA: DMT family transporter [Patescibacteria group bacterium]|nr:DMT family transporter [Patescibacteria group bacterium]
MSPKKNWAIISLVFATLLYGLYGVYSRLIGLDFGVFYQNFLRNLIVAVILIFYLSLKKEWQRIKIKDIKWIIAWVFSGFIAIITIFIAFNKIPIGMALFIFYAGSIISGYLIGSLFFGEKLSRIKLFSIILTFIGLALIYSLNFEINKSKYLLFALIAGFSTGIWNTLSKKVSNKYSHIQLIFIDALLHVFLSLPLIFIWNEKLSFPKLSVPWVTILAFALTQIVVVKLIIYGFRHLEAHLGTLVMPLEVFFGALFGFIFFKEVLSFYTIIGGLIIISGFILPNLLINQKGKSSE